MAKSRRSFAVCVRNDGHEVSLELRKIYGFERDGTGPNGEVLGSFSATGYLPSFLDELIVRGLIKPGERYL